jgi:hypothetical protein
MISKRAWEGYPASYRAREVKILADWIQRGESGSIVGLPGAGKSNLLGFLCRQPEAIRQYLPETFPGLSLIHVDLNNLPSTDLATFFRVILRSFYESRTQLAQLDPSLIPSIEILYRKAEDKPDPFLAQSALREALFLFQEKEIRVVLVLDPFEQFCQTAPTPVLDNLRGLRDSFKTNLSYLMGLRQEVTYVRDPLELGELYEIVDNHLCWLGAMDQTDARWVIGQVETAAGQTFTEAQIKRLIELTGGYPALLRVASFWLARRSPVPEIEEWAEQLLAEPGIQNRLKDMRQGLTGEEEAALSALEKALRLASPQERQESLRQIGEKYQPTLARLQLKHLCQPTESGWTLFSPIFAGFIAQMERVSAGKIRRDPTTDRFFLGEGELTGLSEKDRRLLLYFLEHPHLAHSLDDLIEAAWAEDFSGGVSNEAVQQAIRHLRQQIEPNPARPCYLVTERGSGYRFFPEGAPRG